MAAITRQNRVVWIVLGTLIGMVIGGFWPESPLHATAAVEQENFAIATGLVDGDVEAIFFLDSLTGDLSATVLSPQNGKFLSVFKYNILNDLGVDASKNPKFLMLTGFASFRRGPGGAQLASSVCYVAEVTSGRVAAYGMPWSKQRGTSTQPVAASFILLDGYQFRNVAIRDDN